VAKRFAAELPNALYAPVTYRVPMQARGNRRQTLSATAGEVVERIADRVAELLADRDRDPLRLVDTATVARMLAVSDDWVRDHAAELGAIRVGDGPKGALRFDAGRVRAALERRRLGRPQEHRARRPGTRRRSLGVLPAAVPEDVRDW
jgi:hypothetical protein